MTVNLYYRVGCHLCDDLYELLLPYQSRFNVHINRINVDNNPQLQDKYGLLVPVLTDENNNEICHYFFDKITFETFLEQNV